MRNLGVLLCVAALCSGCLDKVILNGTIAGTRTAGAAFDELPDLEIAKAAAGSGIVQFEGFHRLAPDNEDALFLLLQSWTGYASAFIEDDLERAQDRNDDDGEALERGRAVRAYGRAIEAGSQLLEKKHPGFEAAQKNHDTMAQYLSAFGKDDAQTLLWMGLAWLGRGNAGMESPEIVAGLFVGVAILERAVQVDEGQAFGLGLAALGAYHARSPDL